MQHLLSTFTLALLATATLYAEGNPCIKFQSPAGGTELWDRQAHYTLSAPMNKDQAYTLTMRIKASQQVTLAFWPIDTQSTNRNQWGGSNDVQYLNAYDITTEWATYTWRFTAAYPLDELDFCFGKLGGSLYFDDVVLKEDAIGVNMVQGGDFTDRKTDGWSTINYHNIVMSIVDSDNDGDQPISEPEIPEEYPLAEQGDPNFHIYLAFGQSNMEGNAAVEAQDKQNVPARFKTLAAVNYSNPARQKGQWYKAVPPLCRENTGLTPCDYFGRKLAEELPDSITIGIINVAAGGARIELFMEEYKDAYIAGEAAWFQNICAAYGNDPLGRLVEMGKIAQQSGVIKGILLHQGESNTGASDWAEKVEKIHKRLCYYLGIRPENTPLLAGEVLYQDQGGACWWHNQSALPQLAQRMSNAYIISAEGIPGNGTDPWHFSAAGYRMLGKRYADKMLEILADEAAAITTVTSDEAAESCAYDLMGRPAETTTPGFYVQGRHKILVR